MESVRLRLILAVLAIGVLAIIVVVLASSLGDGDTSPEVPPAITNQQVMQEPQSAGGGSPPPEVVERDVAPQNRDLGAGRLLFAGQVWDIRTYPGAPTTLGDWSVNQVWVDEEGLHLRLSQEDGTWMNAEVFSQQQGFGYGTYTWEVATPLDRIPYNVVLGMFTYETGAPGNREIDIEATQWSNPQAHAPNMHYTLFEADGTRANDARWKIGSARNTTHSFTWEPGQVTWRTVRSDGTVLSRYQAMTNVEPGKERVHMNLWVHNAEPPSEPVHVVISDFTFTPLDG